MYKNKTSNATGFRINNSVEGETIENKIERIVTQKEPIKDGAERIYTDRKDGVQPAYNIRTDRFELAVEGMDSIHRSALAKRDNAAKMEIVKDSGAESIEGTDGNQANE